MCRSRVPNAAILDRRLRDQAPFGGDRTAFAIGHIEAAIAQGAELVLSVNSSNRAAAVDWGVEVIAILRKRPSDHFRVPVGRQAVR